jgi:hypothetical protein
MSKEIALTRSLHIKAHFVAVHMNQLLRERDPSFIASSNLEDWIYYKNISGERTKYNSKIIYNRFDTGEKVELTKEYLDDNPIIRKELLKYSKYYLELISLYPDDGLYINGIINPVDKQKAISAKEGDILAYNANFVNINEVSLINDLTIYIKSIIHRWLNKEYIVTDKYYYITLYGMIITSIPNYIAMLRMKYINTLEVSDEYMELAFDSTLDIGRYLTRIPYKMKLWLYKNLDYIVHNIGKNSTIDLLVDSIFTPLGIDLYRITNRVSGVIDTGSLDYKKATFTFNPESLYLLNKETFSSKINTNTINTINIIDQQDTLSQQEYLNIDKELSRITGIEEYSKKILLINNIGIDSNKKYFRLIMESLLYYLSLNKDTVFILSDYKYIDKEFKLTGEELIKQIIVAMNRTLGLKDFDIQQLNLYVIEPDEEFSILDLDTNNNFDKFGILEELDKIYNELITITNDSERQLIDDKILSLLFKLDILEDIVSNNIFKGIFEVIHKRIISKKVVDISINNDIKLIKENNIDVINLIVKNILNIDELMTVTNGNLISDMRGLLNELTSYTVDVILDTNRGILPIDYYPNTLLRGLNIIKVNKFNYQCSMKKADCQILADDRLLRYNMTTTRNGKVMKKRDNRPRAYFLKSDKIISQGKLRQTVNRL